MKSKVPIVLILMVGMLIACNEAEPLPDVTVSEEPAATEVLPTAAPTQTPIPTEAPPSYEAIYEPAECAFNVRTNKEVSCGYLIVPEDRSAPEKTIRLHVAVISSESDNPAEDPVVYLNGGPGGHTLSTASAYIGLFSSVLQSRDLVLLDMRGVGLSEPNIECQEATDAWLGNIEQPLGLDEEAEVWLEAMERCYERHVANGINLSAYHSKAMADDLEDLRVALGYSQWNLYGVSYGGRAALTALREYGETGSIRSVILDSAAPPQADLIGDSGWVYDRTFDLLFERCEMLETCKEDFPNLEERFYSLVDQLNEEPVVVDVQDSINNTVLEIPFNGDDLINHFFREFYFAGSITGIPKSIVAIENGGTWDIKNGLGREIALSGFSSQGLRNSVVCVEEVPFPNSEIAQSEDGEIPPQLLEVATNRADTLREICDVWQVAPAEGLIESEPVGSDVPTLLLSGDYDPVTPPAYAAETAEHLENSHHIIFEGQSHGIFNLTDCSESIIDAFLREPLVRPDDGCLEDMFWGFAPP